MRITIYGPVQYSTNAAQYTSQNLKIFNFGDCMIESEDGDYECVMSLPSLNNKDRHVRYN